MIGLVASIGISFLYVFLVKKFTKIMVYASIILTLVVFAMLAVYGIIIG